MSQDHLRLINIPERRAEIIAAIAQTQATVSLMDNLRAFLEALPREPLPKGETEGGTQRPLKKITAAIAGKLHEHFMQNAPHLKVARVAYAAEKTTSFMSRGLLTIFVYTDNAAQPRPQSYTIQQFPDGKLDLQTTFVTYEATLSSLDHLKRHLPQFARHALKFNEALGKLRELSAVSKPEGSLFPTYPLSEIYGFYELSRIGPAPVEVPGITQPLTEEGPAQ